MAAPKKINIVGSSVRKLRRAKKWTQEDLAGACQHLGWDIVRETILKIEHGQRRVVDAEVLLLARALSCTLEDLIGTDAAGAAEYARHSLEKD